MKATISGVGALVLLATGLTHACAVDDVAVDEDREGSGGLSGEDAAAGGVRSSGGRSPGSGGAASGGTAAGGAAAGGAASGGTANGDASASGGTENSGGVAGDSGPRPDCTEDERKCENGAVYSCTAEGTWSEPEVCEFACTVADGCTGVCKPEAYGCSDDTTVSRRCDENGEWVDDATCDHGCSAESGKCNVCVPKAVDCQEKQPRRCADDGTEWTNNGEACSVGCYQGECTACLETDAPRCNTNGTAIQTCGAAGKWVDTTQCAVATPACVAGACKLCKPQDKRCNGTTPQTCNAAGEAWVSGPIVAGTCTALCTPGAKQCSGTTPQTCNAGGTAWVSGAIAGGTCGATCTPGATQCSGKTPQACNAGGTAWVSGTITAGVCDAVCTVGTNRNCGVCNFGSQPCSGGDWATSCTNADGRSTYYRDADGDGYCDRGNSTLQCSQPGGYLTSSCSSDCRDGNADIPRNTARCTAFTLGTTGVYSCATFGGGCGVSNEWQIDSSSTPGPCPAGFHPACGARRVGGNAGTQCWLANESYSGRDWSCRLHPSSGGFDGVDCVLDITCSPN